MKVFIMALLSRLPVYFAGIVPLLLSLDAAKSSLWGFSILGYCEGCCVIIKPCAL